MSRTFRTTYEFLKQSQWWSENQIREYQLRKLRETIAHAVKNVPGYHETFAAHGVGPEGLTTVEGLHRFPFLTKEALRSAPDFYVAQNIPKKNLQYVTSGGTTGTPTGFYHIGQYNDDVAAAFRLMMWSRIGYTPACRALDLTDSFERSPIRYAPEKNVLYLSISALDRDLSRSYAGKIRKFQPEFIIGFPSSVNLFAQLVKDSHMADVEIRGIITSSEVMYLDQRVHILEVFRCRILEWYGLAEYAGFGSACEYSDQCHFFPEAGCVELLDSSGNPVAREGEEGEIVLTGFYNWATPFIRYRTGDRAIQGERRCHDCGRNYPTFKKIVGRIQEFLVARNLRLIPSSALNIHSDLFDHVSSYQFYQDMPGRIVLKMVRKSSYDNGQTEHIRQRILERLGDDVELAIEFVESIPRTLRGKHRLIVQELRLPLKSTEV